MIVDRVARTKAILFGLHAWSAICVANGLSRNFTVPVSSGRGFRRNGCITRVVADFARLRIPGGRMMVQAIAASAFRGLFEGLCDANIWTSFRCRATEGARTGRQSDETWSSGWVAALRPG
jgi:hypothetical protein